MRVFVLTAMHLTVIVKIVTLIMEHVLNVKQDMRLIIQTMGDVFNARVMSIHMVLNALTVKITAKLVQMKLIAVNVMKDLN